MVSVTEENTIISSASDDRHSEAAKIVSSAVAWSAATGFVPVPVLDIAALATVQTRMLMDLSALYDQEFSKESARAVVSVLLGALMPATLTGVLGSAIKLTPVVGTVVGIASMAVLGSAATYAIAKVFVRHFEGGGTIASFSVENVKEALKSEFDSAKVKGAK